MSSPSTSSSLPTSPQQPQPFKEEPSGVIRSIDQWKILEASTLRQTALGNFPVVVPDEFMIISHRGAAGFAPDHSMLSFERALTLGVKDVELDIQISKDGRLVLCHDESLDAYGHQGKIADLPYTGSLDNLDFGKWRGFEFAGTRMITLDMLFERFKSQFRYHIELKTEQPELVQIALACIKEHNMLDNVVFTSGFPNQLAKAKELSPLIPRAYLTRYVDSSVLTGARELQCQQICPRADLITPELVAECKKVSPLVRAWGVCWLTQDWEKYQWRIEQVVNSGCDGTTIDHPNLLIHASRAIELSAKAQKLTRSIDIGMH